MKRKTSHKYNRSSSDTSSSSPVHGFAYAIPLASNNLLLALHITEFFLSFMSSLVYRFLGIISYISLSVVNYSVFLYYITLFLFLIIILSMCNHLFIYFFLLFSNVKPLTLSIFLSRY